MFGHAVNWPLALGHSRLFAFSTAAFQDPCTPRGTGLKLTVMYFFVIFADMAVLAKYCVRLRCINIHQHNRSRHVVQAMPGNHAVQNFMPRRLGILLKTPWHSTEKIIW